MAVETQRRLEGQTVALLVADGFEQVELTSPRAALQDAGATPKIVSPSGEQVRGWDHTDWGETFKVDVPLDAASAEQFDALVLPGGVINPDKLRTDERVRSFVKAFFEADKPVAAICHGPWTLIDAGVADGRKMTAYQSIRLDLQNAGAQVVDEPVVVDGNLVTSRNPDDLDAFNQQMIECIARGVQVS